MDSLVLQELQQLVEPSRILMKEQMSKHTSFRVGGEASIYIEISNSKELQQVIQLLNRESVPYFVVGNGTNLLVSDRGYEGVILHIGDEFAKIEEKNDCITVEAGCLLSKVANRAYELGLAGMEFAAGIPGSIGGAVTMNAGAYGGEMSQVIQEAVVMNNEGEIITLSNSELSLGYRTSRVKTEKYIVLSCTLRLHPDEKEKIMKIMKDLAQQRREKQPLNYPSAGSTFKRPEGFFAGKLIMDAGLRGFRIGGAQISEKHCGFAVNVGNATASDVWELMQEVKERVNEKFQVVLEPEVICLGEFDTGR